MRVPGGAPVGSAPGHRDWDVAKAVESSLLLLSHIAQLLSDFSSQSRRGSGAQEEAESSGTNQEPRILFILLY